MRNFLSLFTTIFLICLNLNAQKKLTLIENGVFYDGYAKLVSEPTPENVLRLKNDVLTTKITSEIISQIGIELNIEVEVSALCDNYDRIGNVSLALVPKGTEKYNSNEVTHIELGRFITPFMHKNRTPSTVSYSFEAHQISSILHSKSLQQKYDFWVELEVFGVPYAAQKEVKGCEGRIDVFSGTLNFITSEKIYTPEETFQFIPITHKFLLYNYDIEHTDSIGKTQKTFTFELPENCQSGQLFLITSNHGANEGGEEYIRRKHIVQFDAKEVLVYTPGGKSCEPFRKFNTQGNGIYEREPKTEEDWTSWNNWCPGDKIPTRIIDLGKVKKGKHTFKITVPDAEFVDQQGYFPVSVYFIGS